MNSARSCVGRRPSSTWPTVTPPRAQASVWDHRWRSRWHFAALPGGGWAVPGGGRTSTTPSRWPDSSDPSNPRPRRRLDLRSRRSPTACFWPMTPRCARSRRRCRPPQRIQQRYRCWPVRSTRWAWRCCNRDDRGRPSPRAGADGAGPRRVLRDRLPSWFRSPIVWPPGRRHRRGDRDGAIPVMRDAVDEMHRAGTARVWRLGTGVLVETLLERGAEGDLAEAQEAIDRLANLPARSGFGDASRSRCCGCARCWPGPAATTLPTADLVSRYRAMAESLGFEGHIAWAEAMIERMTAGVACASCGTALRENARFCDECGASLRRG